MKIGNIIYEGELVNHTEVSYINYYKEPKSYDEIDKTLPTLYVGWSFMKKCNPEDILFQGANILKKKIITNELYWEFNFAESKASHVKGVDKFAELVPDFYFNSNYDYSNIDPVFFQLRDVQDLMDILPKQIDSVYVYKDEMLYILTDNKICGINLKMYHFFQFNINDMIFEITQRVRVNNIIYTDLDGEEYQKYYKIFPKFEQLKRYIITILSK